MTASVQCKGDRIHVQALQSELKDLGATRDDLVWAINLAHSRSFAVGISPGSVEHIIAPGLDFANHSMDANAFVRCAQGDTQVRQGLWCLRGSHPCWFQQGTSCLHTVLTRYERKSS